MVLTFCIVEYAFFKKKIVCTVQVQEKVRYRYRRMYVMYGTVKCFWLKVYGTCTVFTENRCGHPEEDTRGKGRRSSGLRCNP